jgi:hypothetical protein
MVALVAGGAPRAAQRMIDDARSSLRGEPPKGLEWMERLSSTHQRQFAVELYSALARLNISEDFKDVFDLLEAWEATAEIDVAPDVGEALRAPKKYREWKP